MTANNSIFPNSRKFDLPPVDKSTVAVIMRTKNRPVLLVRAVSSVLNQNFTDWHLFIVNDGGDVAVLVDALAPYRASFGDRLTIFNNEKSLQMEAASNVAVNAVVEANAGKIVKDVALDRQFGFCIVHDDDDAWHPDFLLETVSFLEKEENLSYAGVCTRSRVMEEKILNEVLVQPLNSYPFLPEVKSVRLRQLLDSNKFPPIAFLFRADLFDEIGGFNPELPVLGDWDFLLRVLICADVGFIDKELAYYHHRTDAGGHYGNSVHQGKSKHEFFHEKYETAIMRELARKDPSAFAQLFVPVRSEHKLFQEVVGLHFKLDDLKREAVGVHFKLDDLRREILGLHIKIDRLTIFGKIRAFFRAIGEYLSQVFFKNLKRLFNIPAPLPGKQKSFFKRLDSFFYQILFKYILNIFKKQK